jgi:hypothetical protein
LYIENEDLFERMMSRITDDFPECPSLHVDWEFALKDKITQEIKSKKKIRVLAVQNNAKNYQHVAIIISKLGHEYLQIPGLVEKFLSEMPKTAEITTNHDLGNVGTFHTSDLKFTGNVYLYTDKLLVSEESLQQHFQKNNLVLLIRT